MAAIALTTAGRVEVMQAETKRSNLLTAAVDIEAGQAITGDANGRWVLAAGTAGLFSNVYIAGKKVKAGQGLTGFKTVKVDGFAVSGMAVNDPVYLSDTPGTIATVAGTNSVLLGRIIAGAAFPKGGTVDKLIQFSIPL